MLVWMWVQQLYYFLLIFSPKNKMFLSCTTTFSPVTIYFQHLEDFEPHLSTLCSGQLTPKTKEGVKMDQTLIFFSSFFEAVPLAVASVSLALGCREDFIWMSLKDWGKFTEERIYVKSKYVDGVLVGSVSGGGEGDGLFVPVFFFSSFRGSSLFLQHCHCTHHCGTFWVLILQRISTFVLELYYLVGHWLRALVESIWNEESLI